MSFKKNEHKQNALFWIIFLEKENLYTMHNDYL